MSTGMNCDKGVKRYLKWHNVKRVTTRILLCIVAMYLLIESGYEFLNYEFRTEYQLVLIKDSITMYSDSQNVISHFYMVEPEFDVRDCPSAAEFPPNSMIIWNWVVDRSERNYVVQFFFVLSITMGTISLIRSGLKLVKQVLHSEPCTDNQPCSKQLVLEWINSHDLTLVWLICVTAPFYFSTAFDFTVPCLTYRFGVFGSLLKWTTWLIFFPIVTIPIILFRWAWSCYALDKLAFHLNLLYASPESKPDEALKH